MKYSTTTFENVHGFSACFFIKPISFASSIDRVCILSFKTRRNEPDKSCCWQNSLNWAHIKAAKNGMILPRGKVLCHKGERLVVHTKQCLRFPGVTSPQSPVVAANCCASRLAADTGRLVIASFEAAELFKGISDSSLRYFLNNPYFSGFLPNLC